MTTLLVGQTVSGMRSRATRAVSAASSISAADADCLACVAGPTETEPSGKIERRRKAGQVDAKLGRVGPDPDHPLPYSGSAHLTEPLDELETRARSVRAVDVRDEHAANARLGLGGLDPVGEAGHDRAQVLTRGEVPRRREEHLSVAQAVSGGVDERLVGDPRPVFGCDKRLLDEPEHGEERIQRVVPIELSGVVDRKRPAGLRGQLKDSTRADGPFDVAVQLDLGDSVEWIADLGRFRPHGLHMRHCDRHRRAKLVDGPQKRSSKMATDIFAKIGDIKGESRDAKHKDEIEVQ